MLRFTFCFVFFLSPDLYINEMTYSVYVLLFVGSCSVSPVCAECVYLLCSPWRTLGRVSVPRTAAGCYVVSVPCPPSVLLSDMRFSQFLAIMGNDACQRSCFLVYLCKFFNCASVPEWQFGAIWYKGL